QPSAEQISRALLSKGEHGFFRGAPSTRECRGCSGNLTPPLLPGSLKATPKRQPFTRTPLLRHDRLRNDCALKPPGTGVRMRGLNPPRGFPHTDLNRARLPIPPHPRGRPV